MGLLVEAYVRCVCNFQEWKAEVDNQTGLKVKCLRSNNGGEYDKSEFKALYAAEGIDENSSL